MPAFSTEEFCGKKNQLIPIISTQGFYLNNNVSVTFDAATKIDELTANQAGNDSAHFLRLMPSSKYIPGHKYFVSIYAKLEASDPNTAIYLGRSVVAKQNFDLTSTYGYHKVIVQAKSETQVYFTITFIDDDIGDKCYIDQDKTNVIDLTEMFGAGNEPTTVADAESKIAEVFGYTADYYPYDPGTDYCTGDITQVKVATTKYVETKFAPAVSELNTTMGTIKNVVDNTIIQADRIGKLATGKQTRPAENCPDGAQCLLITEADGSLHWYPICNADGTVGTQSSN